MLVVYLSFDFLFSNVTTSPDIKNDFKLIINIKVCASNLLILPTCKSFPYSVLISFT